MFCQRIFTFKIKQIVQTLSPSQCSLTWELCTLLFLEQSCIIQSYRPLAIYLFLNQTYIVGTQNYRLNETYVKTAE